LKARRVPESDLRALAAFRYELRCFLAFSEQAARERGIEPQQHQLLLALGGLPPERRPNIRTLAERLCLQHHSAVALVDKLEERGLVRRERSTADKREVLVRLSAAGADLLQELSLLHRGHLQRVGPQMVSALGSILSNLRDNPGDSPADNLGTVRAGRERAGQLA
jgi:DNA-binding MarR family transcriptional regulator